MKAFSRLLAVLLLCLPAVQAAPVASVSHLEAALAAQRSLMAVLNELTTTLQGVTDKESADAAAPAVRALGEQLRELQKEAAGFAAPKGREEADFKAAMNSAEVRQTVDAFMQSIVTLAAAGTYESESLAAELAKLFGKK